MAMMQTAFRTRPALSRCRAVATSRSQRSEMPLFQAFLRPSCLKVTDGFCIKDTTTIDPPYNTGNDFIYEDSFSQETGEYLAGSGQFDKEGNRLVQNAESNGRFHTDWLNMMYPRLRIAKDLLTEDGVIFISIGDNEIENLKKICNEIFGSDNFLATIVWKRKRGRDNSARWLSKAHEYCLLYAKSKDSFEVGYLELDMELYLTHQNQRLIFSE